MAEKLVLVTGGSGHLGFRVVVTALEAGYRVRAPIRSWSKSESIKAAPSIQKHLTKLEFIIVPDIIKEGAFDEAVNGVDYVIHCASPLAIESDDYERDIIIPAVKGTVGILTSAAKVPTVKRIVMTSSVTALIPFIDLAIRESDKVFDHKSTVQADHGPYTNRFQAYSASKVLALKASHDFIASQKPHFDIINLMPGYFIGKNELLTSAPDYLSGGTSRLALGPILGNRAEQPLPGNTVHVNDVAKVEVLALDPRIGGNQDFMVTSNGLKGAIWDDAIEIAKKHFPEAVKSGVLRLGGTQPNKKLLIDSARTEEVFGLKLEGYEEQVKSVVEHYLELLK